MLRRTNTLSRARARAVQPKVAVPAPCSAKATDPTGPASSEGAGIVPRRRYGTARNCRWKHPTGAKTRCPRAGRQGGARRMPVAEAQKQIRDYRGRRPGRPGQRPLAMLAQGLFDHMNAERSQVISGIARYARNQVELAARLRKEASEVDAMQMEPDARCRQIAARQANWETRIFEERVQSLTYVCEVPTRSSRGSTRWPRQ